MKRLLVIKIIFLLFSGKINAQNLINEVNVESYKNYAEQFNYTFWNDNWKTNTSDRGFTNQTNDYALDIDFTNASINSLIITDHAETPDQGFYASHREIFNANYQGDIHYAILQDDEVVYDKSATPTGTGKSDSQMSEFGVWYNRRFVSTYFTDPAPIDTFFTGLEFAQWHDRFKITFHVKPTSNILKGQLNLSIDIPSEYANYFTDGNIHAYALSNDKGFAIKGGEYATVITVDGHTIDVKTSQEDLMANTSYEVSILFHAVTENLSETYETQFDDEAEIVIEANQVSPSPINLGNNITYDENQGIHYIDIPRYGMGYTNCSTEDVLQSIDLALSNASNSEKRLKLCFRQIPNVNVVGFNSLICNNNGDPSGLPLQVSKNWHTTTSQLFSGSWIREYTELIIPANTTLSLKYKRTGAKWGETYTASSHQLSVVGSGIPRGGWLEAALGSFGETVTHSPDYEFGTTNTADVRPFLVTNEAYGGTSSECNWTGNVGGADFWVYEDASNNRIYQSEVKTKFNKYSPNLSETSISAVSADRKLKLDYTSYLNRSDDVTRIYYKVKIKALESTSFNRFDIFQLGGDVYNIHNTQDLIYGNDTGFIGQISPNNSGSNDYTTNEIALTGNNPWVWAGDGLAYAGTSSGIDINTNNSMIIRDYVASYGGTENNTPYFRERSSSRGFSASRSINPTSYCLVTPPGITSFSAGDSIEALIEVVILPKTAGDYYGPNDNFNKALSTYGNSYKLLFRESFGNSIEASSSTNVVHSSYPLTVETSENTALVSVTGGRGYIPLVFSGLTSVTDPVLWKATDNCWERVDQSVHGKDFWQVDYDENTGLFDLIFNVNQDVADDSRATIQYYLGDNPPTPSIVIQSKLNDDPWSSNATIEGVINVDSITLAPQVKQNALVSVGVNDHWVWNRPNESIDTGRIISLHPLENADFGEYTLTYTDLYGCQISDEYTVLQGPLVFVDDELDTRHFSIYPNPVKETLNSNANSHQTKIFSVTGKLVYENKESNSLHDISSLQSGIYYAEFTLENGTKITRSFKK